MSSSGFYTTREAARIAKVPRSTVGYWAATGLIVPSQSKDPRLYSFADLRDLVVASQLREQGAHIRDLRPALTYVRSQSDQTRLAQMNFGVHDGGLIWPAEDEEIVAPHLQGHGVFIVNMEQVYRALGINNPQVAEMRPADRIVINPRVRGGTPVIAGTRIPAALIAELREDGMTDSEIQEMYPSLSEKDIDAAANWGRPEEAAG